jgi:hypothetical protein
METIAHFLERSNINWRGHWVDYPKDLIEPGERSIAPHAVEFRTRCTNPVFQVAQD